MPDSVQSDKQHLKEILDQSSMRNRTLFIAFLFLLTYITFVVWSTTDRQLFVPSSNIELPLLNIPVSLIGFYLMTPIIIWALHFNLLFNLKRHQIKLSRWHQFNPDKKGEIWLLPFLFNYTHILGASLDSRLLRFILSILIYVLPPGILLWIQIRFSAYQSIEMSGFHFVVFCLDIVILTLYWDQIFPQIQKRYQQLQDWPVRQTSTKKIKKLSIILFIVALLNFVGTFTTISGKNISVPMKTLEIILKPHLDLQEEELVNVPFEVWNNCEGTIKSVKGYNLKGRYLNFANFREADLAAIDLRNASLKGANLEGTCLIGANLLKTQFQGATLVNTQLQGATLNNTHFQGAELKEIHFQGAELEEVHFQGAELEEIHFQGATLFKPKFQEATLIDAQFEGATLYNPKFQEATLNDAQFQRVSFEQVDFQGAELEEVHFQEAKLNSSQFQGAELEEVHFQGATLYSSQFQGATLNSTQFQGATLDKPHFQGATLNSPQFQGAVLAGAKFQGAVLKGAKFQGAVLAEVRFEGAVLREVRFEGAVLREVRFEGGNAK